MIANLITRIFQIIFGVIVLGLSVHAIKWQVFGGAPATSEYNAFTGAFCILIGLIGVGAAFVESLPGIFMAAADGLASIFLLAGGIAYAVQLRGVSCGTSDEDYASGYDNFLINGGKEKYNKEDYNYGFLADVDDDLNKSRSVLAGHCRTIEADTAFLFLAFVASVAAAVLCLMAGRRGVSTRHSAV